MSFGQAISKSAAEGIMDILIAAIVFAVMVAGIGETVYQLAKHFGSPDPPLKVVDPCKIVQTEMTPDGQTTVYTVKCVEPPRTKINFNGGN